MNRPTDLPQPAGSSHWFVRTQSGVSGPFGAEEISRRIRSGEIAPHQRISVDQVRWLKVTTVFGRLFESGNQSSRQRSPSSTKSTGWPANRPESQWQRGDTEQRRNGLLGTVLWGTTAGIVVLIFGVVMWSIASSVSTDRESAVIDFAQPAVVRLCGTAGKNEQAWHAWGIVVEKDQVVFRCSGELPREIKIERSENQGDVETVVTGDPIIDAAATLAVVEVELPAEARILVTTKGQLPRVDDQVLLVPPAGAGTTRAQRWRVTSIADQEESVVRFHVRRELGTAAAADVLGCPIVDRKGRLLGIVAEAIDGDTLACTTVERIRAIQQELVARRSSTPEDLAAAGQPHEPTSPTTGPAPATPSSPEARPNPPAPTAENRSSPDAPPDQEPNESEPPVQRGPPAETSEPDQEPNESQPPGQRGPPAETSDRNEKKPERAPDVQPQPDIKTTGDIFIGLGKLSRQAEQQILPLPELPEADAKRFGDEFREQIKREHAPSRDRGLVLRLSRLVNRLLIAADQRPDQFTLTVVEDEENNAFAFVGRNICINTGFVKFAAGDTEMESFVLAHEIGHIVLGHTDISFRRAMLSEQIFPGSAPGAMVIQGLVKQTAYNQTDEADADCFAVRCLKALGMSPRGGVRFFERLRLEEPAETDVDSAVHSLFRSHPSHGTRIRRILDECQ